jgi:hypothetical protein
VKRTFPSLSQAFKQGILLFVLALGLRLIGITWGLPNELHHQSYHPDELIVWQASRGIEPAKLDFDPGFYNYGTLYLTTLRIASDVTAAYTGGIKDDDPDSGWKFSGRCHLAGRIISAVLGAGTAFIIFIIGDRLKGKWMAWFAGGLIAVAPAFVIHSHFQTVDVMATFFAAASTLYAIKLLQSNEETTSKTWWKWLIAAAVFAGLSAATKYTGILVLGSTAVALFLGRGKKIVKQSWVLALGAAIAITLLTFVIGTPGAVLNSAKFMEDFRFEMQHTSTGHGLIFEGLPVGFVQHLLGSLPQGVGILLTVLSFIGIGLAISKKEPWVWVALGFFLPYFIIIGKAQVTFMRYTFPLLILLALAFGWWMAVSNEKGGRSRVIIALGLLAIGGLDPGGLRKAVLLSVQMARPDVRDALVTDLRNMAKSDENFTVGLVKDPWYWTPPTFPDAGVVRAPAMLQRMYAEMNQVSSPRTVRYLPTQLDSNLVRWTPELLALKKDWDVRLLTEKKPSAIVISNFEAEEARFAGRKDVSQDAQNAYADYEKFVTELKKDYEPGGVFGVQSESIHDMTYTQARYTVWLRKKADSKPK